MNCKFFGNLEAAAKIGLELLDEKSRREVSIISVFNPHMRYETDFMAVIGKGLGIFDRKNVDLLRDIEKTIPISFIFWSCKMEGLMPRRL